MGRGVEERALEDLVPVGLRLTVEEEAYHAVAFAIERGEDEDEHTEDGAGDEEPLPGRSEPSELVFEPVHDAGEVERDDAAEDT